MLKGIELFEQPQTLIPNPPLEVEPGIYFGSLGLI
jgi:hypothetical protein